MKKVAFQNRDDPICAWGTTVELALLVVFASTISRPRVVGGKCECF